MEIKVSKKVLFVLGSVICVLVILLGLSIYPDIKISQQYKRAEQMMDDEKYKEASTIFESIIDYKDSKTLITECAYQIAKTYMEQGQYTDAITVLETIALYKDAESLMVEAVAKRKYMSFDPTPQAEDAFTRATTIEAAEETLQYNFYGKWYNHDNGTEMEFTEYQVGGRYYAITAISEIWESSELIGYYVDDPDNIIRMNFYWYSFDYIVGDYCELVITDQTQTETYYSISKAELDQLYASEYEAMSKATSYEDAVIIDKTFSLFKSKVGSNYSGAGTLYHSADYSDAYVTFDWLSQTYTCTMVGKYCTNIFDVFGTSTQTYFVTATFLDTGSELALTGFIMN